MESILGEAFQILNKIPEYQKFKEEKEREERGRENQNNCPEVTVIKDGDGPYVNKLCATPPRKK